MSLSIPDYPNSDNPFLNLNSQLKDRPRDRKREEVIHGQGVLIDPLLPEDEIRFVRNGIILAALLVK